MKYSIFVIFYKFVNILTFQTVAKRKHLFHFNNKTNYCNLGNLLIYFRYYIHMFMSSFFSLNCIMLKYQTNGSSRSARNFVNYEKERLTSMDTHFISIHHTIYRVSSKAQFNEYKYSLINGIKISTTLRRNID